MQKFDSLPLKNKSGLLSYLIWLTLFFVVLELSFFAQQSGFYLGDFTEVSYHLKIPPAIFPGVLFFIFAQFLLHALFVIAIWLVARSIGLLFGCTWEKTQKLGFYLWGFGLFTILTANQYYYPNSKFSALTEVIIYPLFLKLFLMVSYLLWMVLGVLALIIPVRALIFSVGRYYALLIGVVSFLFVLAMVQHAQHPPVSVDASTAAKPNIIIIGVDALRPDFLQYFGSHLPTPHIDHFLQQATVFDEAMTPLARTFPSWISILTGNYPKHTGARSDLVDQSELHLQTLPAILRKAGYETIYAIDETRFSNIDTSLGFDKIISTPMGLNDFLLGSFNDFPLANLVVNTRFGKWLFPYSYGNRPVFTTYDPDSFLNTLRPALMEPRTKPLFFAIHFCLPHFPYLWGRHIPRYTSTKNVSYYEAAVQRADQQVYDFLLMLQRNGLLQHSIVVLLSDHGEALELAGDRITAATKYIAGVDNKKGIVPKFYPPNFDTEAVNESAGHGTDVLGMSQYRSVLAFKVSGVNYVNQAGLVKGMVSLLDVEPTILNLLGLSWGKNDGFSLAAYITGKNSVGSRRQDFIVESDFSPVAVRSVHPETRDVLFSGIDYFKIDPVTTRITVKKEMLNLIISSKQYADYSGEWVLALYPQVGAKMMPILVNRTTGQWTNDLRIDFARHSPAMRMLRVLKDFYGSEIRKVENTSSS
jgi:hypothetical protein